MYFPPPQSPRKQSGFTLIELMVVMAIIAILATAGLSAYTGYIKKARDTTRIADLRAINNIIIASMSTSGTYPTLTNLKAAISAANNGAPLLDPLGNGSGNVGKQACKIWSGPSVYTIWCNYFYQTFDSGMSYRLGAFMESTGNRPLLTGLGSVQSLAGDVITAFSLLDNCEVSPSTTTGTSYYYSIQNCTTNVSTPTATGPIATFFL